MARPRYCLYGFHKCVYMIKIKRCFYDVGVYAQEHAAFNKTYIINTRKTHANYIRLLLNQENWLSFVALCNSNIEGQ